MLLILRAYDILQRNLLTMKNGFKSENGKNQSFNNKDQVLTLLLYLLLLYHISKE